MEQGRCGLFYCRVRILQRGIQRLIQEQLAGTFSLSSGKAGPGLKKIRSMLRSLHWSCSGVTLIRRKSAQDLMPKSAYLHGPSGKRKQTPFINIPLPVFEGSRNISGFLALHDASRHIPLKGSATFPKPALRNC